MATLGGQLIPMLLLTALVISHAAPGRDERQDKHIETLSFCELTSHADRYHRRQVVVKAIYRGGREVNALYDPDCNGGHG
jgi:hypothetical protein